jgi:Uma2 family endonuclease
MSTAADWLVDDENFDPDTLKMPENPKHRAMIETIAVVARHYVGSDVVVYRDMNWYPPDGGHAMAPDLMTITAGVLAPDASSYRQDRGDLPLPGVVVEVPSPSDSFDGLRAKSARYSNLGLDVYVISVDASLEVALRLAPGTSDFVPWTGVPIAPLGGLSIELVDGGAAVRAPDGRIVTPESDILGMVVAAEDRAAHLEAKLRSLGVEP